MIAAFMVPKENPKRESEYIDREEVLNALDKVCDLVCQYSKKQRGVMCAACNLGGAFDPIEELPAADVRPVVWKSVREHTPKPGRYLTCRKTMTMPTSYYYSILSYTDNLESIDEYDFEGENIPGWHEYDSEYGHYSCDNVEWYMPLPPMPPNCGADMREES